MSAAVPPAARDAGRLRALASYGVLDTPPEPGFDDIVVLARNICETPVALVSLVDRDRQWFKARVGFSRSETDLDSSVCAHALTEPDLLVVPDLAADPRTLANPLVTGEPALRFYAGAPLRTPEGHVIGSLCVLDRAPRPEGLSPVQAESLRALARQVMAQMELRRTAIERDAYAQTQQAVIDARGDLDVILDVLVAGAMRAVPAAEGGVLELVDGAELEYRAARGALAPHRGLRVPLTGSASGIGATTDSALLIRDAETDPRVRQDVARTIGQRSAVLAPVRRAGRVLGVLKLQSGRPGAFGERDLRLTELFAGIATHGLVAADEAAAQRAVQSGEARYRTVTDHVAQAVFQMDPHGVVTFVNPPAEAMFGWTAGELIGRNLHATLHHSRPDGSPFPAAECPFVEALRHGRTIAEREDVFFRRDGTPVHVLATNAPVHAGGAVASAVLTVSDVTERQRAAAWKAALLALGDRLRDLGSVAEMTSAAAEIVGRTLNASRAGFGLVDAEAGTIVIEPDWTAEGQASVAGPHRFADYGELLPALLRGVPLVVADVAADPRTTARLDCWRAIGVGSLINMPVRDRGATVAICFVHDARPRRWRDEEITFVQAVADRVDAGVARVRAEAHQRLLNEELSHRLKNTLAMVQAIAAQTLRRVSEQDAVEAFGQRVRALASAHDVLLQRSWAAARVRPVVEAVLGNLGEAGRIDLDGPDVPLGPRATLSLSLVLHELGTNAVKYGALSNEAGRVGVTWRVEDAAGAPEFVLAWRERGGPPVRPPGRSGFGSRLIRTGLVGAGGVAQRYAEAGCEVEMRARLDDLQRT